MSKPVFADIHCHSALKPYGKSYPKNLNTTRKWKQRSIWHRRRTGSFRQWLNRKLTITRFSQSDFTTLSKANVRVLVASYSPLERGFFATNVGEGPVVDLIADWITGIGRRKVNFVQHNKNYFSELENENSFYLQLHNQKVKVGREKWRYRLVRSYDEILQNSTENVISVIPSIEGGHAFSSDNSKLPEREDILANMDKMLQWKYKPLFMSPAHHFFNHMVGHAYSLNKTLMVLLNQAEGANSGITPLGFEMIKKLLDNKVLIDMKHMSRQSRREFYELMNNTYPETPIIASHASVNGYPTVESNEVLDTEHGLFSGVDINLYDDEIVRIGQSAGLIGLQLDERRIASRTEIIKAKARYNAEERLIYFSGFVWNQIVHIAQVLDDAGLPAWDCQCIGSDYDGIVDPLDGFWTSAEYPLLYEYLMLHARAYHAQSMQMLKQDRNKIPAADMVKKVFSKNVMNFLKTNFK